MTLPTGAGKTRVAVEAIRDYLSCRYDSAADAANQATVLWLAHTEELCEQAYLCCRQVWDVSDNVCPLLLVRFWGQYTSDLVEHRDALGSILSRPSILISTPQRLVNLLAERKEGSKEVVRDLRQALGLLAIDEAHRAAAPSYRRILEELLPKDRSVSVIGLTATPFRMEYARENREGGTVELQQIFENLIEPIETLGVNPREKLQEMKILARPVVETIRTETTLRVPNSPLPEKTLSEEDVERIDRALAVRADNVSRRLTILKHLLPIAQQEGATVLYFGPSVPDAECMAFLLRRAGIPAAVVSGQTRDVARRQIIADFKLRKIRVLCNCEVLTTGFDAPAITHVVVARPTVSQVLYEQIVGRGLRGTHFGGTDSCVIIDCEDSFRGGNQPTLGYESFRNVWCPKPKN